MMRSALIGFCLVLLLASAKAEADTRKFAVVLGNNVGHDESKKLRFAEQDAEKFRKVLLELGGFSETDVTLLLDADADQAWKSIRDIENRMGRLARESGQKSLFLFYYSGHAEGDVLEMGSSSFRYDELMSFLKTSAADVRLAFLDSCKSGTMIAMKGGRRGPEFDIQVTDEITSKGYGIITSSADNELSQESTEIRGSFFTHYLVSALRGAGDKSGDGKVTLNEAYQYAYSHTLARTSTTLGGSQHPMYQFQLEGRGEIVLTNTDRSGTRLLVNLPETGRLVVVDRSSETIAVETDVETGKPSLLALKPGSYSVYWVRSGHPVFSARADLVSGREVSIGSQSFTPTDLDLSVSKGGFFEEPPSAWTHRLGVGGLWRLWPLKGGISSYGASLHYRAESPSHWQPTARLTWSTKEDTGVSTGYNDVGLSAGIGYVIPFPSVDLRAEVLAGYEHMFQDDFDGTSRHTSGFDYLGLLGAEMPIDSFYMALDAGAGGRVFQIHGEGWVHRLDVQLVLSAGWRWID